MTVRSQSAVIRNCESPIGVPAEEKRMTPAQVRRRYIDPLADQITSPFAEERLLKIDGGNDRLPHAFAPAAERP